MTKNGTVYVALSGGVDSAVALTLLLEQGYDAIPVFMKCFSEEAAGMRFQGRCPWEGDQRDALAVSKHLGVADHFRSWNFEPEFFETVLQPYLEGKKSGLEPNADVTCNQTVKFGAFFERAMAEGADLVATGHYARIRNHNTPPALVTAEAVCNEPKRDQTYFLYRMPRAALDQTLFPLGEFSNKAEVKQYADTLGLKTADGTPLSQKSSTRGMCFVGKGGLREFLAHELPIEPGPIVTRDGKVVGEHQGVHFYTLGQRKRIGLAGGTHVPYYVVEKIIKTNTLVVGSPEELWAQELVASNLHWLVDPPEFPFRACAAIRHPQEDLAAPCLVMRIDAAQNADPHRSDPRESALKSAQIRVVFEEEQWAPCPGQSVVLYDERKEVVFGGGVIAS